MTGCATQAQPPAVKALDVKIVTGLSGSGKSTALRVLEDLGYFCVDNLPTPLVTELVRLCADREGIDRVALGIDTRGKGFLPFLQSVVGALRDAGHGLEVLFLDAADDVLLRRFGETRRPHPLSPKGDVLTGIAAERIAMAPARGIADRVLDTSNLTVHDLRRRIIDDIVSAGAARRGLVLRLLSFGYRFGVPVDADIVLDARFLPNPHFVDRLRSLPGTDPAVAHFVVRTEEGAWFLDGIVAAMRRLLPWYEREGKTYLTVAIGCTGGRHRSVALVEALAARLGEFVPEVRHRDVDRRE